MLHPFQLGNICLAKVCRSRYRRESAWLNKAIRHSSYFQSLIDSIDHHYPCDHNRFHHLLLPCILLRQWHWDRACNSKPMWYKGIDILQNLRSFGKSEPQSWQDKEAWYNMVTWSGKGNQMPSWRWQASSQSNWRSFWWPCNQECSKFPSTTRCYSCFPSDYTSLDHHSFDLQILRNRTHSRRCASGWQVTTNHDSIHRTTYQQVCLLLHMDPFLSSRTNFSETSRSQLDRRLLCPRGFDYSAFLQKISKIKLYWMNDIW